MLTSVSWIGVGRARRRRRGRRDLRRPGGVRRDDGIDLDEREDAARRRRLPAIAGRSALNARRPSRWPRPLPLVRDRLFRCASFHCEPPRRHSRGPHDHAAVRPPPRRTPAPADRARADQQTNEPEQRRGRASSEPAVARRRGQRRPRAGGRRRRRDRASRPSPSVRRQVGAGTGFGRRGRQRARPCPRRARRARTSVVRGDDAPRDDAARAHQPPHRPAHRGRRQRALRELVLQRGRRARHLAQHRREEGEPPARREPRGEVRVDRLARVHRVGQRGESRGWRRGSSAPSPTRARRSPPGSPARRARRSRPGHACADRG